MEVFAHCPEKIAAGFELRPATLTPRLRRAVSGFKGYRVFIGYTVWGQLTNLIWDQEVQFKIQIDYQLELEGMDHG